MYKKIDAQILSAAATICLLIAIVYITQVYIPLDQLHRFIDQFGPIGTLTYIISVILANIAAPVSASPLLILGYTLYGKNAIWLFALGNIIAMAINFYIARIFGLKLIARLIGQTNMAKLEELSRDYGLIALFLVRVFLSGISDMASYAFGLSPIKFRPYIIVSIVGALPPYLLLYFFSTEDQSSLQFLLMQLAIAGALSLLFLSFRYLKLHFIRLLLKGQW